MAGPTHAVVRRKNKSSSQLPSSPSLPSPALPDPALLPCSISISNPVVLLLLLLIHPLAPLLALAPLTSLRLQAGFQVSCDSIPCSRHALHVFLTLEPPLPALVIVVFFSAVGCTPKAECAAARPGSIISSELMSCRTRTSRRRGRRPRNALACGEQQAEHPLALHEPQPAAPCCHRSRSRRGRRPRGALASGGWGRCSPGTPAKSSICSAASAPRAAIACTAAITSLSDGGLGSRGLHMRQMKATCTGLGSVCSGACRSSS